MDKKAGNSILNKEMNERTAYGFCIILGVIFVIVGLVLGRNLYGGLIKGIVKIENAESFDIREYEGRVVAIEVPYAAENYYAGEIQSAYFGIHLFDYIQAIGLTKTEEGYMGYGLYITGEKQMTEFSTLSRETKKMLSGEKDTTGSTVKVIGLVRKQYDKKTVDERLESLAWNYTEGKLINSGLAVDILYVGNEESIMDSVESIIFGLILIVMSVSIAIKLKKKKEKQRDSGR